LVENAEEGTSLVFEGDMNKVEDLDKVSTYLMSIKGIWISTSEFSQHYRTVFFFIEH
jgi:hypothetical protein